jgi:hypothetical protein
MLDNGKLHLSDLRGGTAFGDLLELLSRDLQTLQHGEDRIFSISEFAVVYRRSFTTGVSMVRRSWFFS